MLKLTPGEIAGVETATLATVGFESLSLREKRHKMEKAIADHATEKAAREVYLWIKAKHFVSPIDISLDMWLRSQGVEV